MKKIERSGMVFVFEGSVKIRFLKVEGEMFILSSASPAGFNPMWNENFKFEVHVPELAMVRFVVEDYDASSQNDRVGQYCLPFTSLQMGKLAHLHVNGPCVL